MPSIHDLLPIPHDMQTPNAYDVFGLQHGDQDMQRITDRVRLVIDRLKSVKEQTDPSLWQQAAKLVDQARQILADPKRKAALDAKLQTANTATSPMVATEHDDPLAGLLPSGNPLAPVASADDESDDDSSAQATLPPGMFGTPAATKVQQVTDTVPTIVQAPSETTSRSRRKRSSANHWAVALTTLALLGLVVSLGYFAFVWQGKIEISKAGDTITVSAEPPAADSTSENQTPLPESTIVDQQTDQDQVAVKTEPTALAEGVETRTADRVVPQAEFKDIEPDPEPPAQSAPSKLAPPQQQAEIAKVKRLIKDANWGQMKNAAESLTEMALSNANATTAQGLFELADLATYYRGGIELAVGKLQAGNDFSINDTFRVLVVETGEDLLTVRYNKKNRSFKFDDFPFSLAHKLASFEVPDGPTAQAAKAAYQAIAPKATDAHRQQSIDWLNEIDGEIKGADRSRLIAAIESVYPLEEE